MQYNNQAYQNQYMPPNNQMENMYYQNNEAYNNQAYNEYYNQYQNYDNMQYAQMQHYQNINAISPFKQRLRAIKESAFGTFENVKNKITSLFGKNKNMHVGYEPDMAVMQEQYNHQAYNQYMEAQNAMQNQYAMQNEFQREEEFTAQKQQGPYISDLTTEIKIVNTLKDVPDMIKRLTNPFISIINLEQLSEEEYTLAYNVLLGAMLALKYKLLKCSRGVFILSPDDINIQMDKITEGIVTNLTRDNRNYAKSTYRTQSYSQEQRNPFGFNRSMR